ncbi:MAG: hypothetical protein WC586_11780 [Methanoregula sp.]
MTSECNHDSETLLQKNAAIRDPGSGYGSWYATSPVKRLCELVDPRPQL